MDLLLSLINAAASGLIALTLAGAVLSTRIRDGVVVKIGLIALALGFGAVALQLVDGPDHVDVRGLIAALFLICSGVAVVILGYVWRSLRTGHPLVRTSDWIDNLDPLHDTRTPVAGRRPR